MPIEDRPWRSRARVYHFGGTNASDRRHSTSSDGYTISQIRTCDRLASGLERARQV